MAEEAATEEAESTETTETTEATETPAADDGDWRAPIEDGDLRKVADRFTTVSDMAKAVSDLRKRESTSIRIPGEGASEEDVSSYRKALGVPDTFEGYDLKAPDGQEGEVTEADTAFKKAAMETFHGLGLSVTQGQGLNEWWGQLAAAAQKQEVDDDAAYAKESEAALKAEWPGEEYDRNKAFADRAASRVFGDRLDEVRHIEMKDGRFVLDHPDFLKMLAGVGREMAEGRLGGVLSDSDQSSLQGKIDEMEGKIEKAKNEGDRSTANKLYQEQQRLYEQMYGTAPVVGAEGRAA